MTSLTIRSAWLQLERLRRHYEHSVRTYDDISLLDLANSLRNWADLKGSLDASVAPRFSDTLLFKYAVPTKKAMQTVRGHEYVLAHMPGGVLTFAGNGELASWRGGFSNKCAVSMKIKRNFDGSVEFASYGFVDYSTAEGPSHLETATVSRGNFNQWLDSEAVRLSFRENGESLRSVGIGREILIRRVANTLGGSHPVAEKSEANSQFDPAVQYLLRHNVAGVPLPYFLLLKAAQDLIEAVPKLLPTDPAGGAGDSSMKFM